MLAMQPRSRPPIAAPTATPPAPTPAPPPPPPAGSTAARPPASSPPPAPAAAVAASAPASSAMVLLLDVSLASPVITLPQNSASTKHVQLDLGTLRLANSVAWRRGAAAPAIHPAPVSGVDIAGPGAEGWQVLMDEMQVGG